MKSRRRVNSAVGPLTLIRTTEIPMKRTFFMVGFVLGLVLIVGANIYSYHVVEEPCIDCSAPFGFPLPMGSFGGFFTITVIFWPGLIANALVSLGAGFVF